MPFPPRACAETAQDGHETGHRARRSPLCWSPIAVMLTLPWPAEWSSCRLFASHSGSASLREPCLSGQSAKSVASHLPDRVAPRLPMGRAQPCVRSGEAGWPSHGRLGAASLQPRVCHGPHWAIDGQWHQPQPCWRVHCCCWHPSRHCPILVLQVQLPCLQAYRLAFAASPRGFADCPCHWSREPVASGRPYRLPEAANWQVVALVSPFSQRQQSSRAEGAKAVSACLTSYAGDSETLEVAVAAETRAEGCAGTGLCQTHWQQASPVGCEEKYDCAHLATMSVLAWCVSPSKPKASPVSWHLLLAAELHLWSQIRESGGVALPLVLQMERDASCARVGCLPACDGLSAVGNGNGPRASTRQSCVVPQRRHRCQGTPQRA